MVTMKVKVTPVTCLLLLQLTLLEIVPMMAAICLEHQAEVAFNGNVTTCCDTCPTGNGVVVQCSLDNQTRCEACIPGKTFSRGTDHVSACASCSTCGDNPHFVLHPCNITHNTVCGCPIGSYYDPEVDTCKFCDLCPKGQGAHVRCNSGRNSECRACQQNLTFSDVTDPFSPCKPCSVCDKSMVALQACSLTEDTLCFSVKAGRHPEPSYNYSTPTIYNDDDDDNGDVIPVYCSVLGLLVVGLLGYVVFKHWLRIRAKRSHKAPCSHEDVEYSKASGADSGVFVDSDSPKSYTYCLNTLVRELPHGKRKEMEKVFTSNQPECWKKLAKELGYNSRRIAEFGPRAKNDTLSPFKRLLHDWERHDVATCGKLIQCLRNIGREDVAKILLIDTTEGRTQLLSKQISVV